MTQTDLITALQTAREMLAAGANPASVAKDLGRVIENLKKAK